MAPNPDLLVLANLLLCAAIIAVSIWSYRRTNDISPLYVGAAFGLFGVTHLATLLGLKDTLEPGLIVIRILAYLIVIFGLFLTSRLILDRYRAEHAAVEGEARYRALFDAEIDGVIVLRKEDCRIVDANASAIAMYGYSHEELVGMHVADLSSEPDKTRCVLLQTQASVPLHYHKKKDGSTFPVEANISTFAFNGIAMMVCTIRDMSDRTRTLQALLQANRKLNLLSSITRHDINNQLTALSVDIELSKITAAGTALADIVEREEQTAGTIRHLIAFTGDYQDIGDQTPRWQNLDGIIRRVITLAAREGLRITADVDALEIFSDPLLEKVIFNLVDNAVRHGRSVTEIRFSHHFTGEGAVVTCQDNGIGIPYNNKERIFERGVGENTGYGLFIAREILGITGMMIAETGTPGEGARFEIVIPPGLYRVMHNAPSGNPS